MGWRSEVWAGQVVSGRVVWLVAVVVVVCGRGLLGWGRLARGCMRGRCTCSRGW